MGTREHNPAFGRRSFIAGSGAMAAAAATRTRPADAAPSLSDLRTAAGLGAAARPRSAAPRSRRTRIGIGYETWFDAVGWGRPEATPVLGKYSSTDPRVYRQHATWLNYAGFDHILVDWSNNLGANWTNGTAQKIIAGSEVLLDVYAKLRTRPEITFLVGLDSGEAGTGNFEAQVAKIKGYLAEPRYRDLFVFADGKPLLCVFTGARTTPPPDWDDPVFTVRWMGAFREIVLNPGGTWSWVDRLGYANGALSPLSHFETGRFGDWKAEGSWTISKVPVGTPIGSSSTGQTMICANTQPTGDAAQQKGTLTSPAFEVVDRVLSFNAIGIDMSAGSDLAGADGRNLFLLRDAASGKPLRWISPPGDPAHFRPTQWNVADLIGRTVVFQAVNNSTFSPPLGWMGLDNLAFQRCEQMVAEVSNGGNEAPGAYTDWDAHQRNSGAYLVQLMASAFAYEPEFLLIQQWNEFGRPDQYGVAGSNDIEPTRVARLAGADSDGWGFYYLKLVRDLIDQYRSGASFPAVTLDTRYP